MHVSIIQSAEGLGRTTRQREGEFSLSFKIKTSLSIHF